MRIRTSCQIRFGIHSVEFRRADQTVDASGPLSAGIGSGKQIIFATESHGSQGTFGGVGSQPVPGAPLPAMPATLLDLTYSDPEASAPIWAVCHEHGLCKKIPYMSIGLSQLLQADTTTAGSPVVSITCKKPSR